MQVASQQAMQELENAARTFLVNELVYPSLDRVNYSCCNIAIAFYSTQASFIY